MAFNSGCRKRANDLLALSRMAASCFSSTANKPMMRIGLHFIPSSNARKSPVILLGVPGRLPAFGGRGIPFLNGMLLACYLNTQSRHSEQVKVLKSLDAVLVNQSPNFRFLP